MKLVTAKQRAQLLQNGDAADETGQSADSAVVKLFDPAGRWTFYGFDASERGDDLIMFGYCVSPLGPDCDEWGYTSLNEVARTRGAYGLEMERDRYFDGVTAAEIKNGARP